MSSFIKYQMMFGKGRRRSLILYLDVDIFRYFYLFQIKLFDGVYLECKPSGYTHNDELIYSRTGKICGKRTFPEDEIRCQAVLQAWGRDRCLCMYANTVFKIRRDDEGWKDDLYECRKFLEKHGY